MGDVVVAPGVRWYRRMPPAGLGRLARAVWWAGHGQLFIGLGLAVLGPALFGLAQLRIGAGGAAYTGVLLVAMAAPFCCSGLMLRRFAPHLDSGGNALFFRVIELIAVVLFIAVLSIAFVFVDMFVLILLSWAWVLGAS
ncbi:hypothetical protein [Leifsonia sp. C5G2]|uniref:hypothetical protein n=1 Tax=Leifsonia sp. C5G2 TaxID=2735269 RepID=UPI001584A535|nr:hypothetical protein [Leifsonia sp. C5G2]NUU07600.1 hypothetical protein [Leifsonia sp. C5G2]